MGTLNSNKGRKTLHTIWAVLSLAALVACMAAIFYLSHQNGEASAQQSMNAMGPFMEFILKYIGHNAFRKIAHFAEYFALSLLACNAQLACFKKRRILPPVLLSVLYSVSDEIHQYFVPGRACRFFDLCVDAGGILLAALVFYAVTSVVFRIMQRRGETKKKAE